MITLVMIVVVIVIVIIEVTVTVIIEVTVIVIVEVTVIVRRVIMIRIINLVQVVKGAIMVLLEEVWHDPVRTPYGTRSHCDLRHATALQHRL
jgi:hypothetical protein